MSALLESTEISFVNFLHLVPGLAALERNVGIMCVGERVTQAGPKLWSFRAVEHPTSLSGSR